MSQWQVILKVQADVVDELTDYLFDLGAVAVTLMDAGDSPIFEPSAEVESVWKENYLTALFEENFSSESILRALATEYPDVCADCQLEQIVEQAWERTCLDQFHPIQFGQSLWICPSWVTPPDPSAVNIILDPGLAFGTGTHPTTALCLEWLDAHPPQHKTVLDYGCGSGILGIAAVKIGADCVWAVDNHEQAIIATLANAKQNHISVTALRVLLPHELPIITVDLLIANILALPLIELASHLCPYVNMNGHIVLSGILNTQIEAITEAYSPYMRIESIEQRDEWVRIVGIRSA